MKGTNNNFMKQVIDSLIEYLSYKELKTLHKNDELIYSSIPNLEGVDDEICACYFDFAFMKQGGNVLFAIGYFPLPSDISIVKAVAAINNINHYAVNFNCSLEKPEKYKDYFLVTFKYTKSFYSNEVINFDTWSNLYNNIRFICLSLFQFYHLDIGLYSNYNSTDVRDFFSEDFLEYTISSLERFRGLNLDKIFKEDSDKLINKYENHIKKCDKFSLYNELDAQLDEFKSKKDDTKLKIISKYL